MGGGGPMDMINKLMQSVQQMQSQQGGEHANGGFSMWGMGGLQAAGQGFNGYALGPSFKPSW